MLVQDTGLLAQLLVRAYPAADLRQGTRSVIKVGCITKSALFDQPHGGGNIIMGGTGSHAGSRVRAVDATRRLYHRPLGAEIHDNIAKVANSIRGCAQIQIIEGHVYAGPAVDWQGLTGYELHGFLQRAAIVPM